MPRSKKLFLIISAVSIILLGFVSGFYLIDEVMVEPKPVEEPKKREVRFAYLIKGEEESRLLSPIDIAVAKDGTIYVTNTDKNRIQVFDENGTSLFHFGDKVIGEESEGNVKDKENAEVDKNVLNYPVSIALDKNQNVFVVDLLNQRIAIFDKAGNYIDDFSSEQGSIIDPTVVTIKNEFIYIFDKFDHQIKKFTLNGELVLTFGTHGKEKGQLQYPFDIAVTKNDIIYVSDTGNGRIQVFDEVGEYQYIIKSTHGIPSGIALDEDENLFMSDPINNEVVITSKSGERLSTISEIVATDQLYFPEGIEVENNQLYIVDKGNNRIIVMNLQ